MRSGSRGVLGAAVLLSSVVLGFAGSALAAAGKPSITSFTPTGAHENKLGAVTRLSVVSLTINGKNFTGATAVKIGAVRISVFSVIRSGTGIILRVPNNVKTGKISVTTKGGTATSTSSFTVT